MAVVEVVGWNFLVSGVMNSLTVNVTIEVNSLCSNNDIPSEHVCCKEDIKNKF